MRGYGFRHYRRRERGLAAVEAAIVLPVVIFLMLATAELGRAFYQYSTLVKAARNGVRYLANEAAVGDTRVIDLTAEKISSTRNLVVFGNMDGDGSPVIETFSTDDVTVSSPDPDYVEVEIAFDYQPLFASLPGLTGGADIDMTLITLSVSTSMRAL